MSRLVSRTVKIGLIMGSLMVSTAIQADNKTRYIPAAIGRQPFPGF